MLRANGKRYVIEWAEKENTVQQYGSFLYYRPSIADTHFETVRFKGYLHSCGQQVDVIAQGAAVWFRFSAMAPVDGKFPLIEQDGKKYLFLDEDEVICWRNPGCNELIAAKDKIIFDPVYEDNFKNGIYISSTPELKKGIGRAIAGRDVSPGDEFLYWSAPFPVTIEPDHTIYSIYYEKQYVHNCTSDHYNPYFVIVKPLDEEREWALKKYGLWLPANVDITAGLAEVMVDNGMFKKGDTIVHSKRRFNQVPYQEKVYAVPKHMVHLGI